MEKYGEFNLDEYPIIVSKTYPIDPTIEVIDKYFDELDKILQNTTGSYCFISYSDEAKFISSDARIHIGKRALGITEKYKHRNKASFIVSNGVVSQLMLKAIAIVYKPLKDSIIVASLDEAKAKAAAILNLQPA